MSKGVLRRRKKPKAFTAKRRVRNKKCACGAKTDGTLLVKEIICEPCFDKRFGICPITKEEYLLEYARGMYESK